MPLSKSSRILILLAIDSVFFLIELTIGYAVHSLALVADSFHMLNDVLSLCVGLWAVKVANQKSNSKVYTYGWQRAETLGALVNGVFLVALCLSIFLEAIQRFVEPQTVSNPMLVLIVGCFGLLSNIMGLFLFHDHGHSHGGGGGGGNHKHDQNSLTGAEEGRAALHSSAEEPQYRDNVADESGNIADVLPQSVIAGWDRSTESNTSTKPKGSTPRIFTSSDENGSTITPSASNSLLSPGLQRKTIPGIARKTRRRHGSGSESRLMSVEEISIHPASFRNDIIAASRLDDIESRSVSVSGGESEGDEAESSTTHLKAGERSPLLARIDKHGSNAKKPSTPRSPHSSSSDTLNVAREQKATKGHGSGGHGHSHDDLNMRGVFLHVMGDALGNIGVIASALFIWLTEYKWRFYADPLISLIITVIILGSAIPLCKAASRILLQAVPSHISVDEVKEDIEALSGIVSCHHLHVWQLSEAKLVASLHIEVEFDFKGEGSARYMELAHSVRRCLHAYGIHSSTIQPEFSIERFHDHPQSTSHNHDLIPPSTQSRPGSLSGAPDASKLGPSIKGSRATSLRSQAGACLLECTDECNPDRQCCGPADASQDQHQH